MTLTISTNDKYAEIESYMWVVNGEEVNGDGDTYTLSAPGKHSYRVMCVFSANDCYASSSMTINGGDENE